jgi:hypothetical protein
MSVHLRAQSAPSTPGPEVFAPGSEPQTPTVKNVHFPSSPGEMEHVRVFNRTAKPSSLLKMKGMGEETETETETDTGGLSGWSGGYPMGSFPFPRVGSPAGSPGSGPSTPASPATSASSSTPSSSTANAVATHKFDLDLNDYPLPNPHPAPASNIFIESIKFDCVPHAGVANLNGTVIVRNVGYEKNVWVRFTLDDWNTTSEVVCRYVASLGSLPLQFLPRTLGDILSSSSSVVAEKEKSLHVRSRTEGPAQASDAWDRFSFSIKLEDYMSKLHERTIWMVGRFLAPGQGEWWDNNGERNYRVKFKKVALTLEERQQQYRERGDSQREKEQRERVGGNVGRSLSLPGGYFFVDFVCILFN